LNFPIILSFIIVFISCYFLIRFFISNYLLKKVRLIYNIIQKSKFGKSSGIEPRNNILDKNVWDSIDKDVEKWANFNEQEIQNLKKLENYRKEFVGNISHELKTPIFTIQGYIHTLLEGGLEDDKVNVQFLRRAANNVDRLINIVDDLETISKLEGSGGHLQAEPFKLVGLINEVILDFKVQAKSEKVELIHVEDSCNVTVKGNREKYRQVFNNLISNSIKYGRKGGKTEIECHDLETYYLIEVKDNGIGIEESQLPHLFDRFYRVDKSRSRDVGGSGLGLSIVKHIIEAHKQTISVKSAPGKGSTFGFTIEKA
jgi:two-component system phosphate regulon sensor histidine kinase PhoR